MMHPFQVVYAPELCVETAGVQFIELDPRKPSEDDKKVLGNIYRNVVLQPKISSCDFCFLLF